MLKILWGFLFTIVAMNAAVNASEAVDYAKIYHKQCGTCHGDLGNGKGRAGVSLFPMPTNFLTPESREKLTLDVLKSAINHGVPGTAMVAYARRFNEQTVHGLAEYIQSKFLGTKDPPDKSQESEAGKKLYAKHCSACHGDNGNTAVWAKSGLNPPPRDFTASDPVKELTVERMTASITYGRPKTAMMPFASRLNKEEIASIVTFIRQSFMGVGLPSVVVDTAQEHPAITQMAPISSNNPSSPPSSTHMEVDMSLPFANGLTGNVDAGKKFYQANCFVCHGLEGDGNGPRAHFNRPRPRDFRSRESRFLFNKPRLFQGISKGKRGTVMPAWSSVLNEQQIVDVAEYVFQAFIQPEQKKKPQ